MRNNSGLARVDRLYVLNAGNAIAPDRSVYSPRHRKGEHIVLPCHAYLFQRAGEWIMWDTGIDDAIAEEPEGRIIAHGIRGMVRQTVGTQLARIGVHPSDISMVILSHAHFDHVGNAGLFPHATWYLQGHELAAMASPNYADYGYLPSLYRSLENARVVSVDGDLDVFGDDSVRIVSTPGHTPGHCSLLIRLTHTGPILLSGDVVHDRFNLDHHCVPAFNSNIDDSLSSIKRVGQLAHEERAQLWINHDADDAAAIRYSPKHYD